MAGSSVTLAINMDHPVHAQRRHLLLVHELAPYPACWRQCKDDLARQEQRNKTCVHVDVQNMIVRRALNVQKVNPLPTACCLDHGTQKRTTNSNQRRVLRPAFANTFYYLCSTRSHFRAYFRASKWTHIRTCVFFILKNVTSLHYCSD